MVAYHRIMVTVGMGKIIWKTYSNTNCSALL